jgi:protein involved in polysaccharide export with SLBB domain
MSTAWSFRFSVCALAIPWVIVTSLSAGARAQEVSPQAPPVTVSSSIESEYQLSAGDVVEIRFFYDPELNEKVQIRPDGHISLSLVGDAVLGNKTIAEATEELERAYKAYLKTPSITIQVQDFASQKVFVGGEILRPGVIPLPGKLSVLDALVSAGGVKPTGNSASIILLRRRSDGLPLVQKISLHGDANRPSQAAVTFLRPYDVILIPEKRIAKVGRWVDQYVRQTIPFTMTSGFTYLINTGALLP